MPGLTLKISKYYEGKPSGFFNDYDTGGFRVYHGLPKRQNPIQKNRIFEIAKTFHIGTNAIRSSIYSGCK